MTKQLAVSVEEFLAQAQEAYDDLTPHFQRGVRYLIDYSDEVAFFSMRQLAKKAQIQPATLLRLAQHFGYAGWDEFKAIFVRSVRQAPMSYTEQAHKFVSNSRSANAIHAIVQSQQESLHTLAADNIEAIEQAVSILNKAKNVYIAGFRSSHSMAFNLYYQYRLFANNVNLINAYAGSLELEMRSMQKSDALILLSFAPYSQEILVLMEYAHEQKIPLVVITDSRIAPIAIKAQASLIFNTHSPSFFPSIVGAHALTEILAAFLLSSKGEKAIKALARSEKQLHTQGAYFHDESRGQLS